VSEEKTTQNFSAANETNEKTNAGAVTTPKIAKNEKCDL
jgi:hypothetical protein